jgi:hypothetical protein
VQSATGPAATMTLTGIPFASTARCTFELNPFLCGPCPGCRPSPRCRAGGLLCGSRLSSATRSQAHAAESPAAPPTPLCPAIGRSGAGCSSSRRGLAAAISWLRSEKTPCGKPSHWTIDRLRAAIADEFGVALGRNTIWVWLRKEGWRPKVPHPRHHKADATAQAEFKKKRPS